VLFHARRRVGLLFGQWAKARGYKAIGTTSSPEKRSSPRRTVQVGDRLHKEDVWPR